VRSPLPKGISSASNDAKTKKNFNRISGDVTGNEGAVGGFLLKIGAPDSMALRPSIWDDWFKRKSI